MSAYSDHMKSARYLVACAGLALLAGSLVGCSPASPVDVALDRCESAQPDTVEKIGDEVGPFTPTEACERYLEARGEADFVATWTVEYTETMKCWKLPAGDERVACLDEVESNE